MIFLSSCVPVSKYERATKTAYEKGEQDTRIKCGDLATLLTAQNQTLKEENALKTQRLKVFNQVDKDGKLYPLRWKGDKTVPVTGTEPWQK